jgi:hypothetical protein
MDRCLDFLRPARFATWSLGLTAPGVATALAEELFYRGRSDAVYAGRGDAAILAARQRATGAGGALANPRAVATDRAVDLRGVRGRRDRRYNEIYRPGCRLPGW